MSCARSCVDDQIVRGSAVEADRHSWPLFRAGSLALGVAPGSLPQKLDVLWTFSSEGGWFESTPAIVDASAACFSRS